MPYTHAQLLGFCSSERAGGGMRQKRPPRQPQWGSAVAEGARGAGHWGTVGSYCSITPRVPLQQ